MQSISYLAEEGFSLENFRANRKEDQTEPCVPGVRCAARHFQLKNFGYLFTTHRTVEPQKPA